MFLGAPIDPRKYTVILLYLKGIAAAAKDCFLPHNKINKQKAELELKITNSTPSLYYFDNGLFQNAGGTDGNEAVITVDQNNPKEFDDITAGEFLNERLRELGLTK